MIDAQDEMTGSGEEEIASAKKVISTGNPEIDKQMGGGIPLRSLTLIEGQSDAGKSVLSQQMIWGSLNNKHRTVLYSTENTVKSFVRQMSSLSLDIEDHLLLRNFSLYYMQVAKGGWSAGDVFDMLIDEFKRHEDTALVVIDSLTGFIAHASETESLGFFDSCKGLCDGGRTIINVVHSYALNDSTLIRIRSMCDAHLSLRIEEMGNRLVRVLEVAKVRGADRTTGNIVAFEVEPEMGMRIIPVTKAQV